MGKASWDAGDHRMSLLARAEEAESKYDSLLGLLPGITYVEELDTGRTLSVSPQVRDILGYTQEEWMGDASRWKSSLHPDDRDRVVATCEAANDAHESFLAEYRMIAKDGRVVHIRDSAVIVRTAGGRPLCWQGVMLDVTASAGADAAGAA